MIATKKRPRRRGANAGTNAKPVDHSRFRSKNKALADMAVQIASEEHPITLRGLFYRVVSAGALPSTAMVNYRWLGSVVTRLRERGILPMTWIVDHCRATMKPSSWSGLADFADTVRRAYRKDFWGGQPGYVEFLIEKDAIAGTLYQVTAEYDVALRVCRGYSSLSFIGEIAEQWGQIEKPITAYYIGDFDPSGFDIERDLREKLLRYSQRDFTWQRLAVTERDFVDFDLLPLSVKVTDTRAATFISEYGHDCAEPLRCPARRWTRPSRLRSR